MTPATIRHRGLIIDLVDTETSSKLDRHGNRASVLEIDRVAPGMGKVFGPQCRVASEEVCFAGSQSTCLFQDPYLNTCTHDGIRVRTMRAAPAQTPAVFSMPGVAPPRS
jgi:hypothetical protein